MKYHGGCTGCNNPSSVCNGCKYKVWVTEGLHESKKYPNLNNEPEVYKQPGTSRFDKRKNRR